MARITMEQFWAECERIDPVGFAAMRAEKAAVDAMRRDAERYRWLRGYGHQCIGPDRGAGAEWTYDEELDAMVDAGISLLKENRLAITLQGANK
jgi:hypothetical protein